MADSIATRVSRIIAGGAHALLDKAEGLAPEASMSQSIREIDQVIGEVRSDLGRAEASKHLVLSQISRLNAEHESLADKIDSALSANRDDLARVAIGRQADIEDLLPVLNKSLDEQSEKARELEGYIVALLAKKRELEQLLVDYRESRESAASRNPADAAGDGSDRQARVEDATSSFNRVLAKQTGASGLAGGVVGDAVKLKELAELHRDNRISERLAALKVTRGDKPS
jgi:phage shock protein A